MPTDPNAEAFKGLDTAFGFQSPFDGDEAFQDDNGFNHAFDDAFGETQESKGSPEKKTRPRKSGSGRSMSPRTKEEGRGAPQSLGVNRNRSANRKSLQKAVGGHSHRVQDGSVGSGSTDKTDKNERSARSKGRPRRPSNDELGYGDPDEHAKSTKSRSRRHLTCDGSGDSNNGRRPRRLSNEGGHGHHEPHRRSRRPSNESGSVENSDTPSGGRRSRRPTNEEGGHHHRERSPTNTFDDIGATSRAAARIRASQFGSAAAAFKPPEPKEEDPPEHPAPEHLAPEHPAPAPARQIRQRPRRRASLVQHVEPKIPERGVRGSRSGDLRPRMRRGFSGKSASLTADQGPAEVISDFPGVAVVSDFPGVSAKDLGYGTGDADPLPPGERDEWAESRANKQREMMERFKQKKDQEAAEKAEREAAEREAAEKAEMEELDLGYGEVEAPVNPEPRPRRRASLVGAFGKKKSFATLDEDEDVGKSKRALKKEEKKKEKEEKKKEKEEKKKAKEEKKRQVPGRNKSGNLGEMGAAVKSGQPAPSRVFATDRERRRPGSLLDRIGNEDGVKPSSRRGMRTEDSTEPSYSDKMLQMLQK